MNATNATNPGTLLGFGTWVAFGAGRVPVGFDAGNALFDAAEETGGSYNATLVSHDHTFGGTTNFQNQNQAHNHVINIVDNGHAHTVAGDAGGSSAGFDGNGDPTSTSTNTTGITANSNNTNTDHTHNYSGTTSTSGASATNANIQPYITVYMWKRTV